MKTTKFMALVILLLAAGTFGAALAQDHPTTAEHPKKTEHPKKGEHPDHEEHPGTAGDIISVAAATGEFDTFLKCVKTAGLVEKLQGKGPFTVFAPTDEAFAKLPAGTLEDLFEPANKARLAGLLANHVVPGQLMAADIKTMKAANVSGEDLHIKVKEDVVTVNNGCVIKADLAATNGVIHAIDAVIVPAPPKADAADDKPLDHPGHR